jgi:hypothetical protein
LGKCSSGGGPDDLEMHLGKFTTGGRKWPCGSFVF